jgi:hypothetical protein
VLLVAAVLTRISSAHAADCLLPSEPVTVTGFVAPATVALRDGRRVRLADVRPAPAGGTPPNPSGPAKLRRVAGLEVDRHGRVPGDIVMEATGQSLSIMLLGGGLAFVDPAVMQVECHRELLAAEMAARRAGIGIWRGAGPVLAAESASSEAEVGRYAIVEGTVLSVGTTRRTVYLNFGVDYGTDFTALARRRDVRAWEDALVRLEGERVRVRGVLEAWHGGLIRIEHPAQVERLGVSAPSR